MQNSLAKSQKEEKRRRHEDELETLMQWVTDRLSTKTDLPRVDDVVRHAYLNLGFRDLPRTLIARRLRLHPAYLMNSSQTRGRKRWRRYRPIITNALGMLHGDIGFFAVRRGYETPKRFRSGFLVLKDVLSRFTYVVTLRGDRTADSMVRALGTVLEQHREIFGAKGHRIKSLAFDREKSVMSNKFQSFLREQHISFHPFKFSASKSKFAEGAIKLIRVEMARLQIQDPTDRWWLAIHQVVNLLNQRPIVIRGQALSRPAAGENVFWRPVDVYADTLYEFLGDLLKADPLRNVGQFEISSRLVKFKYSEGTVVRPKLLITSSAVIGEKRSEVNLEADPFVIFRQLAYANASHEVNRAYLCVNQTTGEAEIFDEDDLAESVIA